MADVTRERQGEILQNVFGVLKEAPNGLEAKDVIAAVEERMQVTPFEDADYPDHPGVRRFPKLVRFATITAVKAGWLVKEDGTWSLTDAGAEALEQFPEPEELMRESVRLYREWEKDHTPDDSGKVSDEDEDEPAPSITLEEAEETAFSEIRAHLQGLDPYDFQNLVAGLLRAMDYHVVWVAPRGADGGLDIVAQSDPLGTEGPRIKGQVKRRKEKAGADDIPSFISLLGAHDVGVFISLGGFTSEAESIARAQETRRLTLLNLRALLDLWIEHQGKLDEAERQLLPLTPVHYLSATS